MSIIKYNKIIISTACVATLGVLPTFAGTPQKKQGKPNIIYILADDLGYAQLGCYGQEKIETPNIDKLAANGIRFSQHYAGAPLCSPSRCVLMTGQHTGHAQIRANDECENRGNVWDYVETQEKPELEGQFPLNAGTETIASLLRKAGYKTGMVGKWGLGGPETDGTPNKLGFDYFYGFNCQRQAWNYYPRYLWENATKVWLNNTLMVPGTSNKKLELPEGFDPYNEESYSIYTSNEYAPDAMQKKVINYIRENKKQPFFLYYATTIPHTALQAPKRWIDYYHKKFGNEEPYLAEKNYFPARYPHATFAAMISHLDEQVGELVAELKKLGIYENTLILFSSDNGPANAGGTDSPWFDSAKPYRCGPGWGKGNVTEGGIRIPMIAQWPEKIKAGTSTDHLSAFYDVMPTLCEIAGITPPQNIDGKSFLPTLRGKGNQQQHEFLYWEFPESGGQQAIRMEKWKGVRKKIIAGDLRIKLYNLEEDTQESNDVSSQHPDIIKQMEEIFIREHKLAENEHFRIKQLGD